MPPSEPSSILGTSRHLQGTGPQKNGVGPNCRFFHHTTTHAQKSYRSRRGRGGGVGRLGPARDPRPPKALGVPTDMPVLSHSSLCRVGKRGFFVVGARPLRNSRTHREHREPAAKHQDAQAVVPFHVENSSRLNNPQRLCYNIGAPKQRAADERTGAARRRAARRRSAPANSAPEQRAGG